MEKILSSIICLILIQHYTAGVDTVMCYMSTFGGKERICVPCPGSCFEQMYHIGEHSFRYDYGCARKKVNTGCIDIPYVAYTCFHNRDLCEKE